MYILFVLYHITFFILVPPRMFAYYVFVLYMWCIGHIYFQNKLY